MVSHENRLLADDSHGISNLIFWGKLGNMSQKLSTAAVVIDALRVICILAFVWMSVLCISSRWYHIYIENKGTQRRTLRNTIG